jgi:AbrB family looped-hinge helix DNA binding protein
MEFIDIAKVTKGGRITIPKKLREKLKIEEGDRVKIYFQNEKIVLEKLIIK